MTECRHHNGYDCGDTHYHPHTRGAKLPKPKQRNSRAFQVAQMLAIILDEPHDNAENPGDIRLEQARQLLSSWNDAQSAVIGMLREVIRIKMGYCVRCPEWPCPVCGADESTRLPV